MTKQELTNLYWNRHATQDLRRELNQFKVDKHGNLLINRDMAKGPEAWEILIPKKRLRESDWISHIKEKAYCDFGEFVCAYLKALEIAGVKKISVEIYGFDDTCKYADGR